MTLALEYQGATEGFILGRSRVGLDRLVAGATVQWLPALCDALNVSVSRGGQRDGLVDSLDVGTLNATFLDAMDPTSDDNVRPNTPVRLVSDDDPIYTGVVQDVTMTDDRDGHRRVTLTAVDGRASLSNTQRYGAVVEGSVGYESWEARINRLRTSAQTATAAPDPDPGGRIYRTADNRKPLTRYGANAEAMSLYDRQTGIDVSVATSGPYSWAAQSRGFDVPVDGLTVGATYRVSGQVFDRYSPPGLDNTTSTRPWHWQVGVVGKGWGAEVGLPMTGSEDLLGDFVFVATSTSHVVRLVNSRNASRASDGPLVVFALRAWLQVQTVTSDPFLLRDVVYESTLTNHFDLACNSVGARWWVDRDNIVQFRRSTDRPDVIAHLSDVHDPEDDLHVCYSDVALGYDTKNAVNNLSLTNHGRRFDVETASWVADDQTSVHEDMTAIASWGARSASVDTSLYTGTGHEADVVIRAYQLLDGAVVPSVRPTSVRFDVSHGPRVLAGLDYYSRVIVTRAGTTWTCRVVGIEHEISPLDGHFITLTLREDY